MPHYHSQHRLVRGCSPRVNRVHTSAIIEHPHPRPGCHHTSLGWWQSDAACHHNCGSTQTLRALFSGSRGGCSSGAGSSVQNERPAQQQDVAVMPPNTNAAPHNNNTSRLAGLQKPFPVDRCKLAIRLLHLRRSRWGVARLGPCAPAMPLQRRTQGLDARVLLAAAPAAAAGSADIAPQRL